jgi:hypothetical protein
MDSNHDSQQQWFRRAIMTRRQWRMLYKLINLYATINQCRPCPVHNPIKTLLMLLACAQNGPQLDSFGRCINGRHFLTPNLLGEAQESMGNINFFSFTRCIAA